MNNPFGLIGKTILVTGASSGIGRAIAVVCSQQGAKLMLTGRNPDRLKETMALLHGDSHQYHLADLTDDLSRLSLIEALPKLDGVVCNAGVSTPVLMQFSEKEDVEHTLQTNAISVIHLLRGLLTEKKMSKGTSVVLVSSINGNKVGYIGSTAYAASKAMLTGFMKAAALELAAKTIRINSIEPGMVETALLDNSTVSQEDLEADKRRYPLKRYGKPEEVAYAAVYLLSDATAWMTGTSIVIDGGYTLA